MSYKILIVGTVNSYCLETSYENAAAKLSHMVVRFDPSREVTKFVRFGRLGKSVQDLFQPEIWLKKMNRELVIRVKESKPDIILVVGGAKVLYGTLVTIKVIQPGVKIVWIWPDTPANLNFNNISYASILDLSATYSEKTVPVLQKLGFSNVHWIPLAGDPSMHWKQIMTSENFERDISFVGMWRPERERVLKLVCENFGHLKIEIYGKNWKRNAKNRLVLSKWRGEGMFTNDLAHYFNTSRINLNIIDDTNFPAANMRFFEIATAGGLQVSSSCPEMHSQFRNREDLVYFQSEENLIDELNWVLAQPVLAAKMRATAQANLIAKHTYATRLETIIKLLNNTNQ